MELQDFVKETLTQITTGVKDSQDSIRQIGGYDNPAIVSQKGQTQAYFGETALGHQTFLVDFDVAVRAVEKSGGEGRAKLAVASLLLIGGSGHSDSENESTSRIKFQIPLALPFDEQSMTEKKQKEDESQRKIRNLNRQHGR